MKVNIEVEKFDNGITIRWKDTESEHDPQAIVALERDKQIAIGNIMWADIKTMIDSNLCNTVKIEIEYKPIQI